MIQPVVCPKSPLSRDLDVEVVISRPLTEIATDMSLMCFLTPDAPLPPNNGRVRYYSSFSALAADTSAGSAMYQAGQAFFNRSVRPQSMAVGRVFEQPVPAGLLSGGLDLAALRGVDDGAFALEVNGSLVEVDRLNLTGASGVEDVVNALRAALPDGLTAALEYGGLVLATSRTGDGATLSYAETPGAPPVVWVEPDLEDGDSDADTDMDAGIVLTRTDVSALLGLTRATGAQLWQGYTPQGLAAEAELVRTASRCNQRLPYGWTIDAGYRDTEAQKELADWAETLAPAYFSACTNSASAFNPADATNIGLYAADKGYIRTSTIYHNNAQVYPDVSYMAYALATNYSLPDSAITMKFKQLDGIEPSPISETELAVLNARRINSYVYIGNTSRTVREGVQALDSWYTDSLVNLDNFREELQVEVYNVFLRSKKVPFTSAGQDKLVSAAAKICRKYTRNGVFADRDVEADVESGYVTLPATHITPVSVAYATTSERASRTAPPVLITAYEAGAFHKVSVRVDVYN